MRKYGKSFYILDIVLYEEILIILWFPLGVYQTTPKGVLWGVVAYQKSASEGREYTTVWW